MTEHRWRITLDRRHAPPGQVTAADVTAPDAQTAMRCAVQAHWHSVELEPGERIIIELAPVEHIADALLDG